MAYDEELNSRWRAALADREGVSEKRMMGGGGVRATTVKSSPSICTPLADSRL